MKVVTITNKKGGVGKTTTVINLSSQLAARGFRVLVLDLDSAGQSTEWVGIEQPEGDYDHGDALRDAIINQQSLKPLVFSTNFGFDLIPCGFGFSNFAMTMPNGGEFLVRRALRTLSDDLYDIVVIDTEGHLDKSTVAALVASDSYILPVECKKMSLSPTGRVLRTIEQMRDLYSLDLTRIGILATVSKHTNASKKTLELLREAFPDDIFKTVIRENTTLGDAFEAEQPIDRFDPKSHGAMDYSALADEFLSRIGLEVPSRRVGNG